MLSFAKNAVNFQEQISRKDLENIKQNTKRDFFFKLISTKLRKLRESIHLVIVLIL